jgi:hypothetical protein
VTTNPGADRNSRGLDKVLAVAAHNLNVRDGLTAGPRIMFHPTLGFTMPAYDYTRQEK